VRVLHIIGSFDVFADGMADRSHMEKVQNADVVLCELEGRRAVRKHREGHTGPIPWDEGTQILRDSVELYTLDLT
jgi:hypothetical protein